MRVFHAIHSAAKARRVFALASCGWGGKLVLHLQVNINNLKTEPSGKGRSQVERDGAKWKGTEPSHEERASRCREMGFWFNEIKKRMS